MKLLMLFLFLFYTNAYAKEYQSYSCTGEYGYPFPLDDKCYKDEKIKFLFKVNVENQVVIMVIKQYLDKTYSWSEPLENCKVADKNNWYCTRYNGGRSYEMLEGVYREYPTWLSCIPYVCKYAK